MAQVVEEVQTEISKALEDHELSSDGDDSKHQVNSSDPSPTKIRSYNLQTGDTSDDETVVKIKKKRLRQFSASDSDRDSEKVINKLPSDKENEGDTNTNKYKSVTNKRIINNSDTSDSGSNFEGSATVKNEEQQIRMKNKRNKLRDKFKSLVTSRAKEESKESQESQRKSQNYVDNRINTITESNICQCSDESNDEIFSVEQIKQKIKAKMSFKPSICDPDTSDEETTEVNQLKQILKKKKPQKSSILTSPKPMRMSAKQAMENMQKIKSESNRMLREKEVSLPYHRPKALSLKDIMSRRKPATTADGKALPIKMNAEQLQQYVLQLEQRQKDIMELCKSDTDDEKENDKTPKEKCEDPTNIDHNLINISDSIYVSMTENNMNRTETSITDSGILPEDLPTESNDINPINIKEISNKIDLHDQAIANDNIDNKDVAEESGTMGTRVVDINIDNGDIANTNNNSEERHISLLLEVHSEEKSLKTGTEADSQLISLHYDSENRNVGVDKSESVVKCNHSDNKDKNITEIDISKEEFTENGFSDEDINMDEIERIIENAEVIRNGGNAETVNSPLLVRDPQPLNMKPKLTGAPGMVIDLDGTDPAAPKKLSGVELLKERFTYFAKLKSPEEMEREKETKIKPGTLHLKLKQDLEEKIAEQRSLEWAKRLEEERQQQIELKALRGDDSDFEDDIEKIEAKLEEKEIEKDESSEEEEQEEEIDEVEDKPRKRNPLIADEAEESDCEETDEKAIDDTEINNGNAVVDDNNESSEDSSDDESSESEDDQPDKVRKGRILKAFEDSDDEGSKEQTGVAVTLNEFCEKKDITATTVDTNVNSDDMLVNSQVDNLVIKDTQDDEIQLAQRHKSASDDLFTSQESALIASEINLEEKDKEVLGTQTFSIINEHSITEMSVTNGTPIFDVGLSTLNTGSFSQNLVPPSQLPTTLVSQSQSQPIGEDILALCTGNFYDNQFISPSGQNDDNRITQDNVDDFDEDVSQDLSHGLSMSIKSIDELNDEPKIVNQSNEMQGNVGSDENIENTSKLQKEDGNLLKSILEELHDPEFDSPKPNKYFFSKQIQKESGVSAQLKKKFVIDSDEETDDANMNEKKKKKIKKRKLEKRALQISDDEEDEDLEEEDEEEYVSDIEDESEHIVEYDSEENEVEVKPQNPKKKRKAADFFEQEAELTSEDEWVGSGDEDEAGLDRMEREEGDDDTFHQGKLQSELGQIHIRDVLDQDKREVRIIQELLFEDGDLGDGHRQRKFRWRNADGETGETDTRVDEFGDTQEEEFESEEQWRKQRHEREVFLRQMQNETEDSFNVSVSRSTIIKANLCSKTMSSLLKEVNTSNNEGIEKTDTPVVTEKRPAKDIPSPKKVFTIYQQNYHGSLLTRGRGALARLAALATPLAVDDDAPKVASSAPSSRRNFVFSAVAREDSEIKVTKKRKADAGTPRLVKKLKTDDKQTLSRNSLLDHLKA